MEKLKIILFSLVLLSFISCTAQNNERFYKAVVENDENTLKEHFPDTSIYYDKREIGDPDKKIFDLLKEQLKNVNHIYYAYLPEATGVIPGFVVKAFIYDVDNNKIYFLEQDNKLSKDFILFEPSLNYYKYRIEYYNYKANFFIKHLKNNDCESIKSIEADYNQIGQVVYDINLKEKKINRCSFNQLNLLSEYGRSIKVSNGR